MLLHTSVLGESKTIDKTLLTRSGLPRYLNDQARDYMADLAKDKESVYAKLDPKSAQPLPKVKRSQHFITFNFSLHNINSQPNIRGKSKP